MDEDENGAEIRVSLIDTPNTRACETCRFWTRAVTGNHGTCGHGPPPEDGFLRTDARHFCGWHRLQRDPDAVRRPSRAVPPDFETRWPALGWGKETGAEYEWGCHSRTISRWLDEVGRDRMILARKKYRDAQRTVASRARRKRYVLGRTLSPVQLPPLEEK